MNPWVMTTQSGYNESWKNNIQTSLTLEQKLDFVTKGLRFVGRFGYDTYNSNWIKRYKSPAAYKADRYRQPDGDVYKRQDYSRTRRYFRESRSEICSG